MTPPPSVTPAPSREQLLHSLYEAAELEHCLMCTYLYAAFSLKSDATDGLSGAQLEAVTRWRRVILDVAVEEMGHLVAVWNITAALGGAPRFGRANFPLDPGALPAGVVVRLAPFNPSTLQHFIHLERPEGSAEAEGEGFAPERSFTRAIATPLLTPTALDYDTVGTFYRTLGEGLRELVAEKSETTAFDGDPALQLSMDETGLKSAKPVICLKTALAAFDAIVAQGEGAAKDVVGSHYQKFVAIRDEYDVLRAADPQFVPAFPAATNPVLRRPPRPEGRVWIEDARAAATVDLANASYSLMLRLLAYAYVIPRPHAEKQFALNLANGLMHAMVPLAERAARLPAGPTNPDCHAGMSFTTLRDASALPPGTAARRFFRERIDQLASAAEHLREPTDERTLSAANMLIALAQRAARDLDSFDSPVSPPAASPPPPAASTTVLPAPVATIDKGVERAEGEKLTLLFEAKRCIHSRLCVTGAPEVFLANVQGPWLHPDAMDVELLAAIAHACPSGAIRYQRRDGHPDEPAPQVNLAAIREAGPYAFRGDLRLNGESIGFRATLCRCGASKNKPFCDSSHHDIDFTATGEPASGPTDMLAVRDGELHIDPQINGPLQVRGNLEITSGTGRVVARITSARLCRCGGSQTKPFCDGSHARIGFAAS
jgi:CDGSH-type Zn-finger protein/uncharacterized Fe-S cluster protein YjdI